MEDTQHCPFSMRGQLPVFESPECLVYGVFLRGPYPREALNTDSLLYDDGSEFFYSTCRENVDGEEYSHSHDVYGVIRLSRVLFG